MDDVSPSRSASSDNVQSKGPSQIGEEGTEELETSTVRVCLPLPVTCRCVCMPHTHTVHMCAYVQTMCT